MLQTVNHRRADKESVSDELKKKSAELNQFIYKASHDIRGPLASIIGLSNVALSDIHHPEAQVFFNMIADCAQRLDKTLQELLQLSAIGQGDINVEKFDVRIFFEKTLGSLDPMLSFNGVKVTTHIEDVNDFISDQRLLGLIVHHLVDNAIKFRNCNAPVSYLHLTVRKRVNGIVMEFADNGIGVPMLLQERVFEMFFRGTEHSAGQGLGLYVVDKLVKKLGGTINLFSKEKEGSRFEVFIPGISIHYYKHI